MSRMKNLFLLLCLLLVSQAYGQSSPASVISKSNRISSQLSRSAHHLNTNEIRQVSRLLSEISLVLNGNNGGPDCYDHRGRPVQCDDGRGGPGGRYGRISGVGLILEAQSTAYYTSDKLKTVLKGFDLVNDRDLNRLADMCDSSSSSTELNCIKGGLNNTNVDVLLGVNDARDMILTLCSIPSSSSTELSCFKKTVASLDVSDFDYVMSTCQSHYYTSEKVSCIKRSL